MRDGLQIVYAHRSFQEYFAARFICEAQAALQEKLISKYSSMSLRDNVLDMLYEMRPEIVERYYILPGLDRLFDKIGYKRSLGVTHHERFIKACFRQFVLHNTHPGALFDDDADLSLPEVLSFTMRHCGHLIGWKGLGERKLEKAYLGSGERSLVRAP